MQFEQSIMLGDKVASKTWVIEMLNRVAYKEFNCVCCNDCDENASQDAKSPGVTGNLSPLGGHIF